jgi:hypothetical protein
MSRHVRVAGHGDIIVDLEGNSVEVDKLYPIGPTCFHNGHEVSTYVTIWENGSITSEILTNFMRHLDTHLQWDRTEATPFLYSMVIGAILALIFCDVLVKMKQNGPFVWACLMALTCGRWATVQGRTEHSKWH